MGTLPKILIMASGEWVSTARLALALREAGCHVELVTTGRHPALSTREPFRRHAYAPLQPVRSLERAIAESRPDLLIAADELMVLHLEELWDRSAATSPMRMLIERSLGGRAVMQAARSRIGLMHIAEQYGLPVPPTLAVDDEAALAEAIDKLGLPLVLKADATSGGRGVRLVADAAEARRALGVLRGPTSLPRAAKRALVERELFHLRPWLRRERRGVIAQQLIAGSESTAMAVCTGGEVLACICFQVLETWVARGPSSLVRVVTDPVMLRAVTAVAGELRISGFCGFDFMRDEATGQPLLIEMNPRPTQLVHLSFGEGRDLIGAYVREVAGHIADDRAAVPSEQIGVFPHELQRDPEGRRRAGTYLDVPWNEPALIARALGRVPPQLLEDARWKAHQPDATAGAGRQPHPSRPAHTRA